MNIFSKIWSKRHVIRALPYSIYFNLRCLPLKQAIRVPILIYKPNVLKIGKILIEGSGKFGSIRLGFYQVSIYPNSGITWENNGIVRFRGRASIGNNAALSIGPAGLLDIGDNFINTCQMRLVCYHKITLENNVLVGWDVRIADTNFHILKRPDGSRTKGFGPVYIGAGTWVSSGCRIFPGVSIPAKCTIAAESILVRSPQCEEGTLILTAANRPEYIYKKAWRDYSDDKIDYPAVTLE